MTGISLMSEIAGYNGYGVELHEAFPCMSSGGKAPPRPIAFRTVLLGAGRSVGSPHGEQKATGIRGSIWF